MSLQVRNDVYAKLRNFQEGNYKGNGTCIGMLDQSLTALYDDLVKYCEVQEAIAIKAVEVATAANLAQDMSEEY